MLLIRIARRSINPDKWSSAVIINEVFHCDNIIAQDAL